MSLTPQKRKRLAQYQILDLPENSLHIVALASLMTQRALETGETIYSLAHQGHREPGTSFDDVVALVSEHLGMTALQDQSEGANRQLILIGDDSCAWVSGNPKTPHVYVNWKTLDQHLSKSLKIALKAVVKRPKTQNQIFVVVASGGGGLSLQGLGAAGEDFVASNYEPETAAAYDHVVKDLQDPNPCGRIVIFDGPPRCGKTHAIRALLRSVEKAMFIMVPSAVVSQISGPSFLPVLMQNHRPGRPMILVLEDADEAVAVRKADNVSAVSALLNLSDGIYGACLDIRIVATTNKSIEDLDPAVIGPGRLCTQIFFPELTAARARIVHERLTGAPPAPGTYRDSERYSLGHVYKTARPGPVPAAAAKKGRAMGFQLGGGSAPPPGSPAAELGLAVGDKLTTDEGTPAFVRPDGQLQVDQAVPDDDDDEEDEDIRYAGLDDDDDLIDEDPPQD